MIDQKAKMHWLVHHATTESQVYPNLAAGVNILSDNAADWTYGAYATIVAASTITSRFHIHNVSIESCNQNGVFQLALYRGSADDLIATIRFAIVGGFWGNAVYLIASEICEANDRIRARLAYNDVVASGQATAGISICYCVEA